ncbi:MAG: hypothetical protein M1837_006855 [Sclerophora amabilis]|nr:MAG: hypothetical protein M1837_006855 [Sclerophora amabilis]
MLFDAEHESALKKWLVRRLEDISDADSEVLADYVLALLRQDSPQEEVRKLCVEQLEDFLKEHTGTFVDDIFTAINLKSYDPSSRQSQRVTATLPSVNLPNTPRDHSSARLTSRAPESVTNGGQNLSKKRSHNEFEGRNTRDGRESHNGRNAGGDRALKQPRRGSFRGGRFDSSGNRGSRQGVAPPVMGQDISLGNLPGLSQSPPLAFPGMPTPPPGFPFDPNDPIPALMAMQAMGFPPLPNLPQFPHAGSPTGFVAQSVENKSPGAVQGPMVPKVAQRCKDYDEKGFCALGNTCPYQHGVDHIIVPDKADEYDPSNSSLLLDVQKPGPQVGNGNRPHESNKNSDHGRGRGRGRGAGGGYAPTRKGRADFSQAGPNHDRSITTVVVENIPEEKFNEQAVRDFFSSFGIIQDVQMQAYKRLALVQYDSWLSAKKAYDSPRVIFDNRFVKVYWYKPDPTASVGAGTNGTAKAGSPTSSKHGEEAKIDLDEIRRRQDELQKAHEEKMKKIKETESFKIELERRKEELMKTQAEEKKKLMERLESKLGKGKSMSPSSPPPHLIQNGANGSVDGEGKKTSSQTDVLRAQLAALEAEAKSLGIDSTVSEEDYSSRGRGRGRSLFRGRGSYPPRGRGSDAYRGGQWGRGAAMSVRGNRGGTYKLDNRTKKVAVSGVDFDEKRDEALRQYLLGMGEFENIEPNPERKDSQLITFKDRFTAEKLVYGASDIPSVGKVEISWVNTPLPPVPVPSKRSAEPSVQTASLGDEMMRDHEAATEDAHKNEDYDVAEDDDRWMVE